MRKFALLFAFAILGSTIAADVAPANANYIVVTHRRCGRGSHWVPAHRDRFGHWVGGHCQR